MKPSELMADLPTGPGDPREARLSWQLLLEHIATRIFHCTLESGSGIHDVMDARCFLEECANAARTGAIADVEIVSPVESRAQLRVTGRVRTPNEFCPACGHVHIDDDECNFPIGGGRRCRCERKQQ